MPKSVALKYQFAVEKTIRWWWLAAFFFMYESAHRCACSALISRSRLFSCSQTNFICFVNKWSCPIIWSGAGLLTNITLLGTASNWPATIRTAVRSSTESPKEMISRLSGSPRTATLLFSNRSSASISISADSSSEDEIEETSVPSILAQDELLRSSSVSTSFFTDSYRSFTSWANAAAFQHNGWPG